MDALLRQRALQQQSRRKVSFSADEEGDEDLEGDDEEELKRLREQSGVKSRVSKPGPAGASHQIVLKDRSVKTDSENVRNESKSREEPDDLPTVVENAASADGAEEESVELLSPEEAAFRSSFPVNFGKTKADAVNVTKLLETQKRKEVEDKEAEAKKANKKEELERMIASASAAAAAALKPGAIALNKPAPQEEVEDGPGIGPPRPDVGAAISDDEDDGPMIGPPRPKAKQADSSDDEGEDDDEEGEEYAELNSNAWGVPDSHEAVLQGHIKPVTSLSVDPAGGRVVTGGSDYQVFLYDFAGMNSSLRYFRQLEPQGSHQIRSTQYSITGEKILVASGSARPKIIDRDGHEIIEFMKGDMYIVDMVNTKGHTAAVHDALWHPTDKNICASCSDDSTVRLWDVNTADKQQKKVIKVKKQTGQKTAVISIAFSSEAKLLASASMDGSVQLWDIKMPCIRPVLAAWTAHAPNTETSSLVFSRDAQFLVSRGGDDTVKMWDVRQLKAPVRAIGNLPNYFAQTDVVFSPDEKLIATGTSVKKNEGSGCLVFLDKNTFDVVRKTGVSASSVIRIVWHPKINQIFAGCSDCKTHVFYDPTRSEKGALMAVTRIPRQKDAADFANASVIINPHSLPMYRAEPSKKRKAVKDRKDPVKSRRPDLPAGPQGSGGRLGKSFQAALLSSIVTKRTDREEDPREAILRHAEAAAADPFWVSPAYAQSQPKPIFDTKTTDDDGEEFTGEVDPSTGMRVRTIDPAKAKLSAKMRS